MQLDKIIIALRQRSPWEAMDLGIKLMRVMWPVIFFPWLILLSIALAFTLFAQYQGYVYFAVFFIWWIKPVYESMILYILSRGIFGEYPGAGDVFTHKGDWFKTGILTTVFFWRLSPARSFNMPVHQLEGLSGSARKSRLNTLHRLSGSHAMGATVIGIHFEYLLAITLYVLLFMFAPEMLTEYFDEALDEGANEYLWYMMGSVVYAVVIFIMEPFYVAAGFMLYLNRRTQLEAWDVELDFKNLVQRVNEQHGLKVG